MNRLYEWVRTQIRLLLEFGFAQIVDDGRFENLRLNWIGKHRSTPRAESQRDVAAAFVFRPGQRNGVLVWYPNDESVFVAKQIMRKRLTARLLSLGINH